MWAHHQPPMAKKLSQKRKFLKYKQYLCQLKNERSMTLKYMHLEDSITTIAELLNSPIYNFVTLVINDCGYEGTTEYLIVNYVHPLSLKAKAAASQADSPKWRQDMDGQFADEYWE